MSSLENNGDDIMDPEATAQQAVDLQPTKTEWSKAEQVPHGTETPHTGITPAGAPKGLPDDKDSGVKLEFLTKIPWSWYHTRDSFENRIARFKQSQADYEVAKKAWEERGRPTCPDCEKSHPPPHLPPDLVRAKMQGVRLGKWLLKRMELRNHLLAIALGEVKTPGAATEIRHFFHSYCADPASFSERLSPQEVCVQLLGGVHKPGAAKMVGGALEIIYAKSGVHGAANPRKRGHEHTPETGRSGRRKKK